MSFQQSSGAMGSSGISYQTESSSGIQYNQGVSQLGASFGGTISGGGARPQPIRTQNSNMSSVGLQAGSNFTTSQGTTLTKTNSGQTKQIATGSSVSLAAGSSIETNQSIENNNNPATMNVPAGTKINATPGTKIDSPSGNQEVIKESSSVTTSEKTEIKNPNKESQKGGVSYETDNEE